MVAANVALGSEQIIDFGWHCQLCNADIIIQVVSFPRSEVTIQQIVIDEVDMVGMQTSHEWSRLNAIHVCEPSLQVVVVVVNSYLLFYSSSLTYVVLYLIY